MGAKSNLENMSEKEILIELLKEQRGETRARKIIAGIMIAIFVLIAAALIYIVPKAVAVVNEVQAATAKLTDVVGTVESKVDMIDSTIKDIDGMVKNVDNLVVSNTENLSEAVEKLNSIEFDTLNKAINDFAATVQPVANFFNSFKVP